MPRLRNILLARMRHILLQRRILWTMLLHILLARLSHSLLARMRNWLRYSLLTTIALLWKSILSRLRHNLLSV